MHSRDGWLGDHTIHRAWQAPSHPPHPLNSLLTVAFEDSCIASAARAYLGLEDSLPQHCIANIRAAICDLEEGRACNPVAIRQSEEGLAGGLFARRYRREIVYAEQDGVPSCRSPINDGLRQASYTWTTPRIALPPLASPLHAAATSKPLPYTASRHMSSDSR